MKDIKELWSDLWYPMLLISQATIGQQAHLEPEKSIPHFYGQQCSLGGVTSFLVRLMGTVN